MSEHHHEWAANDTAAPTTYNCATCTDTTTGCNTCNRPLNTQLLICDPCLTDARKIPNDIAAIIDQIPDAHADLMGLRAVRYDKAPAAAADPARLPFGLDAVYDDPDQTGLTGIRTPEGALDVLYGWADDWAGHRNEPVNLYFLDYLADRTLWAAQNHPAWTDYLNDARAIRAKVRHLAGLDPQAQAAPCVHCGGTVIQEWTDNGLEDELRCTRCGMTWKTTAALLHTNHNTLTRLPDTHPELLVTIEEAKRVLPHIRRNTLDVWARRGLEKPEQAKFPTRGRNTAGRHTYRLGDIIDAWNTRQQTA